MLSSNKPFRRGLSAPLSLLLTGALAASLAACGTSPAATSSGNTTAAGGSTGGSGGQAGSSGGSAGNAGSGGSGGTSTGGSTSTGGGPPGWVLDWADEFDLPDGSPPDPAKWTPLVGGDGWGNQEREYYTKDAANAQIQGGILQIVAKKDGADQHQCWYGACQYTSARLQTKGMLERTLGRFEARMKIPKGQGVWPAFWMLGANIDQTGWPGCGEIDVMENIGKEPGTVHGSLHGPGYSGGQPLTGSTKLASGALGDDFHLYAVEWEQDAIRFYLDDSLYETHTPKDVPAGAKWVYDHPFFLLLNLAIGGGWPGDPDGSTVFPAVLQVDYVRVYKRP